MSILVCENLKFVYSQGTPFEHTALDGVSFDVNNNEIIGIIGHTGSGKSTFIQHLNGLIKPSSGTVILNGEDIWDKKNKKNLRSVRFTVGLCFQYPEQQIFEETIFDEIAFGPKQMGLDKETIKNRVLQSMELVGLEKAMCEDSPFELSGGQKRRVAIASIIAMEPKVLILDEPCAGLDPQGRNDILNQIKEYQAKTGNTVIFVSHSMEDVAKICDRILVMQNSKIRLQGTVDEVFSNASVMKEIGLDVPEITDVFLRLHDMGVPCNTNIYTIEQGIAEYNRLKQMEVGI